MSTTRVQDFFKATITRNWTATVGDFNVSVAPTVVPGIIVISPNSATQREIVRYTAVGTNQYGPYVKVSDIAHRGLSGTTAQSHIIGEQIRMNVTAVHWDELLADAVAPTVDVGTTTTLEPGSDATVTNSGDTINATLDFEIPAGSTIYSGTSIPDNSVGRNGDWAFDTSANSYVWYKSGDAWALVNSLKGATGDGNGIASIVKTDTVGLVDTYTITYDDDTTTTFNVTNGQDGTDGDDGAAATIAVGTVTTVENNVPASVTNSGSSSAAVFDFEIPKGLDGTDGVGIDNIALKSTVGKVKTYTITYTDATTFDYDVIDGADGIGSGDVLGPATNNADYIPQWNGTNSKTLKNGINPTTLEVVANKENTTLDTSTTKYPTNRLTKEYADSKVEDSIVDGHTTVAPSGNAVFDALASKANVSSVRERLTANRTYYVRTDGNDSNTGLVDSAGGAFLTIQKAIDTIASLDCSIYNLTIQIADGTYTGANILKSIIGSGYVTIQGNSGTPANVLINSTGTPFAATGVTNLYIIKDLKIITSANGIQAIGAPTYIRFSNIVFGATTGSHLYADGFGTKIEAVGNYSIVGSTGQAHIQCVGGGKVAISGKTITLTGTPNWGAFFIWMDRGLCMVEAFGCTFSGSATGTRYTSSNNSVIFTAGAGLTYLPGSVNGSVSSGGLYV